MQPTTFSSSKSKGLPGLPPLPSSEPEASDLYQVMPFCTLVSIYYTYTIYAFVQKCAYIADIQPIESKLIIVWYPYFTCYNFVTLTLRARPLNSNGEKNLIVSCMFIPNNFF